MTHEYPKIADLHKKYTVSSYESIDDFVMDIPRVFGTKLIVEYDESNDGIVFNLCTGTKSDAVIFGNNFNYQSIIVHLRYDKMENISNMFDVLSIVRGCMLGRSYIDEKWKQALIHYGFSLKDS